MTTMVMLPVLSKGKRKGKTILFDGHIDTVPVPDPSKWEHDPFGGELTGGKIFGRGASDMKGALSAMVGRRRFFCRGLQEEISPAASV